MPIFTVVSFVNIIVHNRFVKLLYDRASLVVFSANKNSFADAIFRGPATHPVLRFTGHCGFASA